ncbi:hypothetical protein IQ48_05800 [Mycobacterium tuberculosis]|nr:hypothetical protein IQ48_05800 [Mycobacterium tuberculosis]
MQCVTIPGDHQHPVALVLGLGGQRGDEVVGLEPRLGEHGDAECAQHFFGDVDLASELVGGRRSVGLVLRVALQAEGLPGHVESRRDVRRGFIAQQVDQHGGEAVDGVGGQPAAGLEVLRGQCVERPKRQRIAIQQHQRRLGSILAGGTGSSHHGSHFMHRR